MDFLTELAIKYRTDKWGKHNYTPYYFELFKGMRDWVKKVVEVGVAEGAGVRMFRDFFPNAMIYGAEIDKKRIFSEDRIRVIKCDQSKTDDLVNFLSITGFDIDIFVDDGSHEPKHQVHTCLTVLPLLKKESVYIIEDVSEPSIVEYFEDFDYKLVRVGERYDDQLLILRQK
jgi:8-demethyl-8-alpha-L-rhamnosyltetracenomycin-C 2'-O-methyltransferase